MKRFFFFFLSLSTVIFVSPVHASDCGSAQTIVPKESLNVSPVLGTFLGETFSGESECSGSGSNADVWFKFQANATKMFVRTITAVPDMDLVLEVRDACTGTPLDCINNTGDGGAETASLTGLTIGNIYYARVYRSTTAATSGENFSIAVSYVPTVQLKTEYCGLDDYTTNQFLKSTQPTVTTAVVYYQWRFQELEAPFDTYQFISPETPYLPNFRLKYFDAIEYGRSYDVSVRVAVSPGVTLGNYGPACTITLQDDVLTTQLEEQYNVSSFAFCDVISCYAVGAADRYRWQFNNFEDPVLTCYGVGNSRLLRIYDVPGIKIGKTYIVNAFAEVNGQESPVGATRFISTNNFVPNTGLRNDIYPCGGTYPLNSQVQAFEICHAESYTWRFKNTSQAQPDLIYTRIGGSRFIRLEWVTGLIPGDSYDLDVKARQGAKNGDYSSVCNITIGAPTNGFGDDATEFLISNENQYTPDGYQTNIHPESVIELSILNNGGAAGSGLVIDLASADENMEVQLELYDLSGKQIAQRQESVTKAGQKFEWRIPGFSAGIYILRASNGDYITTKKVSVF